MCFLLLWVGGGGLSKISLGEPEHLGLALIINLVYDSYLVHRSAASSETHSRTTPHTIYTIKSLSKNHGPLLYQSL